jgi:hypothetical protein
MQTLRRRPLLTGERTEATCDVAQMRDRLLNQAMSSTHRGRSGPLQDCVQAWINCRTMERLDVSYAPRGHC